MSLWFCLVVLCMSVQLHQGDTYNLAEPSDVDERLDILTNEITRLKDRFAQLQGAATGADLQEFGPLEAKREFVQDGVKFTVKYRVREDVRVMLQWWDTRSWERLDEFFDNSIPRHPSDIQTTSTITQPGDSYVFLYLMTNSGMGFNLYLRNDLVTASIQTNIPIPVLEIDPPGDIVYNEGQDAVVKLTVPPKITERSHPGDSVENWNYDISVHTTDSVLGMKTIHEGSVYGDTADYFHVETSKKYLDSEEIELILNTSTHQLSGFLQLQGGQNYENGLVKRVSMMREVIIRPATQDGPLPPGYLRFQIDSYEEMNEEGEEMTNCRYKEECTVSCTVIGYKIPDFSIVKVMPDGTEEPVPFTLSPNMNDFYANAYITLEGMRGGPREERYRCKATALEGVFATHTITVSYMLPTLIHRDETSATWIDDNNLDVTCVASGDPLPNITFTLWYERGQENEVSGDPLEVTGDIVTATKVLAANDEYKGKLSGLECHASAGEDWKLNDSWYVTIPSLYF